MARRGPFLPQPIAEAAIADTTPKPFALPDYYTPDVPDAAPNVAGWEPNQPDPRDPYGIRAPYQGPPEGYYGASSSPGETLRNVAEVFNPLSENSVFGTFAPDSSPVMQELLRPSNYVGAGSGVRGIARGALSGIGGRFLGEAAMEAVPEDAPLPLRIGAGLAGGLVGGVAGYRAIDDVPLALRGAARAAGAVDDALGGAEAAMRQQAPEAFQAGRVPGTDELFTFGPQGENVGPTGNVYSMRFGRGPVVGPPDVTGRPTMLEPSRDQIIQTNLGRAYQEGLAAEERAAFQSAYERSIAGAERGIGGGADLAPDEFARLAAKKAAGEALTPEEQDSVLQALGKAMGATTADEQAAAREALYNGPVPTDMRDVDTGLIEGVRRRLGAPTGSTVEDALRAAREGEPPRIGGGADVPGEPPMVRGGKPTAQTYTAPPTLQRLFGTREIVPGEQRGALERVAEEGRFRADDPIVTPALRVRAEARRAVENQATRVTAQARTALARAFQSDADGRIATLAGIDPEVPGAPTIRDVAARLPRYEASLTAEQRQALQQVRDLVAPYRQALDEVAQAESAITGKPSSIKIGSRADVLDGGFYIPRGTAETEELADIAARRVGRGGGRVGGKQGFEKSATFGSEAEGIEAGYRYTPIDESLASYVRGAGNRALDRNTANYFLTRVDESGQRLAQSRADRLDPTLRADVESLRQRIASRLQTLRNQTVRGGVQQTEAQRYERLAERISSLTDRAQERAGALPSRADAAELANESASALREAAARGRRLTAKLTRATDAERRAATGARRTTAEIDGLTQELTEALADADALTGRDGIRAFGGSTADIPPEAASSLRVTQRNYAERLRAADRVQNAIKRLADRAAQQEDRLAAAGVERSTLAELRDIAASDVSQSIADLKAAGNTDALIRVAQRELRTLETQARQAGNRATTAGARAGRTAAARQGTMEEIAALRTELDTMTPRWQRAQEMAAATPRDRGSIPLAGLDAYAFPYEMADEAARELQKETRNPGTVDAALRAVNGVFRGIQATGEMSYLGIQNAIGTVADPMAGARAAKASTKAWLNAGDEVLGDFISRFDARTAQKGLPSSEQWAASGLRLGGAGTEFRVGGRKLPERVANVVESRPVQIATAPVRSLVKRADRGFGVAGDTMRLELADTLAEETKLKGRTLDERTMRNIAESANRVTGWTPQRAFGDWGEVVNFAPRYLAARARALGQLASRDPQKRQLARRLVGRYLAIGTAMTVAINELNGEETDYRPFSGKQGPTFDPRKAEYKNPNFMRVMNVAGRDWSLLGPMDALLGTVVGAGSLVTNPTGDPKQMLERVRSIFTAPTASAGLDWMVFGEDFDGNKLTLDSEAGVRDLLGRVLPFATSDLGGSAQEVARQAQEGDIGGAAAETAGGLTQGFIGGRGSRQTPREQVERGRYSEMPADQQFKAIPAQAWNVVIENMPEQFQAAKRYQSAGQFYQALVDEYTQGWIDRGVSPLEAEARARASAARHPVYKAYINARNYYENEWTARNPELRQQQAEEQLNLPPSERRNMPRQQERRIIEGATR